MVCIDMCKCTKNHVASKTICPFFSTLLLLEQQCGIIELFENHLCKLGKVDAPVFPDVSAFCFTVFVWVLHLVEILAIVLVLLEEEVGLADGDPVEDRLVGKHLLEVLCYLIAHAAKACLFDT